MNILNAHIHTGECRWNQKQAEASPPDVLYQSGTLQHNRESGKWAATGGIMHDPSFLFEGAKRCVYQNPSAGYTRE
jgi:hypothetical protein